MITEAELLRLAPLVAKAVNDIIVQTMLGNGPAEPFEVAATAAIDLALEKDRAGR